MVQQDKHVLYSGQNRRLNKEPYKSFTSHQRKKQQLTKQCFTWCPTIACFGVCFLPQHTKHVDRSCVSGRQGNKTKMTLLLSKATHSLEMIISIIIDWTYDHVHTRDSLSNKTHHGTLICKTLVLFPVPVDNRLLYDLLFNVFCSNFSMWMKNIYVWRHILNSIDGQNCWYFSVKETPTMVTEMQAT